MKRILLSLIVLLSIVSCKKEEKISKTEEIRIPVTAVKPVRGEISFKVKLSGKVEGNPDVLVFTTVPGYYLKRLKNEGDYVRKGDIILLLERRDFGLKFEPVKIEAPVSGRISYFKFDKGEYITPNRPLARIYGDREFKVKLSLPSDYAKYITKRKKVKVFVNSDVYTGRITEISSASDPFTGNFYFEAVFKPDKKLLPGTPCEVEVEVLKKENVLKLPSKCVLGAAKKSVFVVKDGVAKRVPVITGIESEGYVEIIKGVSENDFVVFKGAEVLREGMKIEIVNGG
jgi:multidrug efflux pump subunit AcrA (membrane-fusion protein)